MTRAAKKISSVSVGFDPDSTKHGVAVFIDGALKELECLHTIDVYYLICELIKAHGKQNVTAHIENLCGVSSSGFHIRPKDSLPVKLKKAENVGMCKQAQRELEFLCDQLGIKYKHHKISKLWKNQTGRKQFELVTGWKGQSNEDSRSAAYFGWLGCK